MPRLRLVVLGFDLFWLGIVAKLTGKYGNASGFKAPGIFTSEAWVSRLRGLWRI